MLPTRLTHFALVLAASVLWSCVCLAADTNLQAEIETILEEEGLTGIGWVLIDGPGERSMGAAGMKDNAAGLAFETDTRFHVGSVTKAVLATGVLRLVTEGRIGIDAPVLQYLPDLFPNDPPAGFSDVTVRHLLDHTAGLNDSHLWQMFSERAEANAPLAAAFPEPSSQLQIRAEPGARFSYSNMGYTLLGMIIEAVVGEPYEPYLDEHLLAPLGMHDSTFVFTTQEGEVADPALAWGHIDDGSRYGASPIFLRPAGQFTSTAGDLARFAEFLLSDGIVGGQTFIEEALMTSRGKPAGTEAANEGLAAGYSLGIGRRDRHGVVGYCHGGNIVGFVAMMCFFPDEQKAFAYSVNTDSETANYGRLDSLFIKTLGINEAPAPPTSDHASDIEEWFGRYVMSPNRFRTFEYLDTVFGAIRISESGNGLAMSSMQRITRELRSVGDHLYSANDRTTASHVLFHGDNGEYLISDGFVTYKKVSSAYLIAHWASILLGLVGLVWFFLAGTVSLLRYRVGVVGRPEAPAYLASLLLFAPIPVFLTQSFMALGDMTPASFLLALVTFLLPFGMLATLMRAKQDWSTSRMSLLHGIAAVFVLQWCAVLVATGMLPFRLWA